jgi:hypothetical protein
MENTHDEIIQFEGTAMSNVEASERANIDIMISTAKRYPRNIKRSTDNAMATVSMNKEAAQTCSYALPRGDKQITGPSVHLARILAQSWGNIRVDSRVKDITPTQVVSESICMDLETNYGVRVEVRRSIVNKNGQRFNEDMITVTGNACNAIAYRNAVLAVIPKPVIDSVYNAAQNMISGDLSDEQKLITRRKEVIDGFINTYGVTEAEVVKLTGKGAVAGIKRDEIVFLIGIAQAIKDGDTSSDEVFGKNSSVVKTAEKLADLSKKGNETLADKKKTIKVPDKKDDKAPEAGKLM